MRDRGKAVETYNGNGLSDNYYSSSSDLPCRKHPSSSSVGICAYCLKDRLIKLVCSDCGEQRLSSCSCSEISSNRNSCTVEVGSVGRISFLIENEKSDIVTPQSSSKPKSEDKSEEVILLRRSSSSCVDVKKSGFWGIGKIFGKKREKGVDSSEKSVGEFDDKSESCGVDYMGVSRSRSLCSFRGGCLNDPDEGGDMNASGARSSGVNGGLFLDSSDAEPRRSGFDSERKNDAAKSEIGFDYKGLKSGGNGGLGVGPGFNGANRRVFSLRESDFTGADSGFIDLKFDFSSEAKPGLSAFKMGVVSTSSSGFPGNRGGELLDPELGGSSGGFAGDEIFTGGGSCRITVNDRGIRKSRKSVKVWRWIFRHHPNWGSSRKKDEDRSVKV
ncbi:uncharacterized protein LOC131153073 [Malania oleifera]|uniref:uncharacterized protein LOC131153073 n=1 Tax=Malania oleifera TaxID=397392 RepID=UPI0025AE9D60|nr:uncharacterized protein LOC131153073 [Malania oleifera]